MLAAEKLAAEVMETVREREDAREAEDVALGVVDLAAEMSAAELTTLEEARKEARAVAAFVVAISVGFVVALVVALLQ